MHGPTHHSGRLPIPSDLVGLLREHIAYFGIAAPTRICCDLLRSRRRVLQSARSSHGYPTLHQSALARPATIALATGEGSEPSIANPSRTWTAGWATIRGIVPRCGQVAVCTMNG